MTAMWLSALDEFADHLADERRALAHGLPPQIRPLRPPTRRGPLPPSLWQYAEALLDEADELGAAGEQVHHALAPRHVRRDGRPLRPRVVNG